jgi:chemotaxis protein histidine kinase CheA
MLIERNNWNPRLPEFLIEAEMLLAKSEECLAHLQLIKNDPDAIHCLLGALLTLANRADVMALGAICTFARSLHAVLSQVRGQVDLHDQALGALKECLTLIAWQLELVDRHTGDLRLDNTEQAFLLEAFVAQIDCAAFPFAGPASGLACANMATRRA